MVTFSRVFSLLYSGDVRSHSLRNHIQRLIFWNKKRGLSGWHVVCMCVEGGGVGGVHQGDYNISRLQMEAGK